MESKQNYSTLSHLIYENFMVNYVNKKDHSINYYTYSIVS